MSDIKDMLYQQQKFLILNQYANSNASSRSVTGEYAFAWDRDIYPLLDDGVDWHKPFEEQFSLSKERMEQLHDYLVKNWDNGTGLTFYKMEDHFNSREYSPTFSRSELVSACHYFKLHRRFDDGFWMSLLNGDCPAEAHSVWEDFEPHDVYFC